MQALGTNAAFDPVYAVVIAFVAVGALSLWALRSASAVSKADNPLEGLFEPSTFETRLDSVAERLPERRRVRPAHPHGQRAQMARLREVWAIDSRDEAIEQVARVLRAGNGVAQAPVEVIDAAPALAESEWEEVKLLPPPASEAA